jgi:hypothetical protein
MPNVVLTAQIQDASKWEAAFRTHVDVLRTYTLQAPVQFAIAGNEVALYLQPKDMDAFGRAMESKATVDAMAYDGVKAETVRMFVLDKTQGID